MFELSSFFNSAIPITDWKRFHEVVLKLDGNCGQDHYDIQNQHRFGHTFGHLAQFRHCAQFWGLCFFFLL